MSEQSGHEDRLAAFAARYPAGPPGRQGERGPRGDPVPRAMVRAFIFFTLLNLGLIFVGFLGLAHYVNANSRARCDSLLAQISIPIPTPVAGHESRLYEEAVRKVNISRARHLGCHLKGDQ